MTTGAQLKELFLAPFNILHQGGPQGCVECRAVPPEPVDVNDSEFWDPFHCECEWDNSPGMWRRLDKGAQKDVTACMILAKRAGMPRDVARLISLEVGKGKVPPLTYQRMRERHQSAAGLALEAADAVGILPLMAQFVGAVAGSAFVAMVFPTLKPYLETQAGTTSTWFVVLAPVGAGVLSGTILWLMHSVCRFSM